MSRRSGEVGGEEVDGNKLGRRCDEEIGGRKQGARNRQSRVRNCILEICHNGATFSSACQSPFLSKQHCLSIV